MATTNTTRAASLFRNARARLTRWNAAHRESPNTCTMQKRTEYALRALAMRAKIRSEGINERIVKPTVSGAARTGMARKATRETIAARQRVDKYYNANIAG